jgi:hypothetical protein
MQEFSRFKRWSRLLILGAAFAFMPLISVSELAMQKLPFSPTQAPPGAQYVGAKACAKCHEAQAATQPETSMGRALETGKDGRILRAHPQLELQLGKHTYKITRQGDQSFYTVTDGQNTITEPIAWAFGLGAAGQTYVFQHNGRFYESRVSFFNDVKGLGLTLGAAAHTPKTIEEAAGRVMQSSDTKDCFGCHATAAVSEAKLQLEKLTPGITCEACHGPGAAHVALAKTGQAKEAKDKQIFNPAVLSPYDLSQQFCGACHRSWDQVMLMTLKGVGNVRFQPYRITYSPCYDPDDRRITCAACHDPHREVETNIAAYDAKCLTCHQLKPDAKAAKVVNAPNPKATPCKVGTQKCASCHMPKYELPGAHFKFTDHMIRVVKPGEAYPN